MWRYWLATATAILVLHETLRSQEQLPNLSRDVAAAEKLLVKALKDDDLWMKPIKQPLLLEYLKTANLLRSPELAPILAENIAYGVPTRRGLETVVQRPAYVALRAIGMDAVKPILAELKSFDPEDPDPKTDDEQIKRISEIHRLRHRALKSAKWDHLIHCLIEIYAQGGFGKSLARQRIELEMGNAKGKEKERLSDALKHSALE